MPLLLLLLWLFSGALVAQQAMAPEPVNDKIPLRTLVQLNLQLKGGSLPWGKATAKLLSAGSNVYQLVYQDEAEWLTDYARLSHHPAVAALQFDYRVEFRRDPNDEFYERQPNLERMGFTEVWEDNTGGLTPEGDQIVVAILDAGFDIDHPDLAENIWVNTAEIPNDGIDNDSNGYRDDVHGWDFLMDRPEISNAQHGSQVLGIMGARGDNEIGIAGTGWNHKMMLFTISDVSDIIAAYEYIIEQRRRWQNSGGNEGALVVATNASFGLEGQYCSVFPIWGQMYDRMGEVGILTAAGTANRSWDVDEWGDMPTSCPSEYLLGVANLGEDNRLWRGSAWGSTSIDLVAAGQGSYTTTSNGLYGSFGSNSAAAPYVTGAIALLYGTPCARISMLIRQNPSVAARLMRQAILRGIEPQASITQLISTGGLLDVVGARDYLTELCAAAEVDQLTISRIYPNPARGNFQFEFGDSGLGPYQLSFIDFSGRVVRSLQLASESSLPISNTINTAGLPPGVYLLRLSNGLETSVSKVILQ